MKSEQALAWAVIAFILFALCSRLAGAASVEIHYQNPGTERAYEALDVCRESGCLRYPAPCAPGASCAVTADLAPGTAEVWLVARIGERSSLVSNRRTLTIEEPPPPFDAAACLALDACRFDADGSGSVTIADFGRFLSVLGATWP